MINLLPPEAAKQLRASRHNSILLRYLMGTGVVLVLIIVVYAGAYIMMRSAESASTTISQENQAKIARLKAIETKAKAYKGDLDIAKSIFNSELSYTTALHKVASALPAGAVVESLDLNPTITGQPITLLVSATTKTIALSVKDTLEKAGIASNITIASLQEQGSDGKSDQQATSAEYPIQINLNLTFQKTIFSPGESNA